jgi:predicted ATPase
VVTAEEPAPPEVEPPITIGVLGAHSTGKSTFLARLAHELRRRHIQVATVADLGEQAQRNGMPILFNHTWASTLWFVTKGISQELEAWAHAEVVLVDRAVPDALGYYQAALAYRREEGDPRALAYLRSVVRGHSRFYDLIFRTTMDPDIPLGDNKERDRDDEFRTLADHHVERVLNELGIPHEPLAADGHDQALERAVTYIAARLADQPTE